MTDLNCRKILMSKSGLTLLEMIVAMAILTVGIVGVLHAFSASMAATKDAELYSRAVILSGQVESELARRDTLEAGTLFGTFEGASGYSWEAKITPQDTLLRLDITISWKVGSKERHFDTVVCLRPPDSTEESS